MSRTRIRALSEKDFEGHFYQTAHLPMALRMIDTNPDKSRKKNLGILHGFTTGYLAREINDGEMMVVGANAQMNQETVHLIGRTNQSELIFDSVGVYLVSGLAYISTFVIRCEIGNAIWDVIAYYYTDNRNTDVNQYTSVESAFDHDDRTWQACTMQGVVIPQLLTVKRVDRAEAPVDVDLDQLPLVNGKPMIDTLCMFENLPEIKPDVTEHEEDKPSGIVGPDGRPFGS